MRLRNIQQIEEFLAAVRKCKSDVWLESTSGDKFSMKSKFSTYVALGALLSAQGDQFELFCANHEEEVYFYDFFNHNPDVLKDEEFESLKNF